jgi:hypothetical protein
MSYTQYHKERNNKHLEENKKFPLKVWQSIVDGNPYKKENSNGLKFFESISKKIERFSKELNLSEKKLCESLLSLEGIGLDMALNFWAVKPETQNLNEEWKKDFIENNSKLSVKILSKSGAKSLMLNEKFEIKKKLKKDSIYEKDQDMKTFDFLIKGLLIITEGTDGLLVVDKTTKVTGGSQKDTERETLRTIQHLSKDPKKRTFCILLDGGFWEKFRNEMKGKYENILIMTSDELILL